MKRKQKRKLQSYTEAIIIELIRLKIRSAGEKESSKGDCLVHYQDRDKFSAAQYLAPTGELIW